MRGSGEVSALVGEGAGADSLARRVDGRPDGLTVGALGTVELVETGAS